MNTVWVDNRLLEGLARINLRPVESRVMVALLRRLGGWHRDEDCISPSQIAEITGIYRPQVYKVLKALEERNIIRTRAEEGKTYIAIIKDPEEWRCGRS